jgi:methyl-accepting chemotaxis protein
VIFSIKNIQLFEDLRDSEVRALFTKNIQDIGRVAEKFELGARAIGAGANVLHTVTEIFPQYNIETDIKNFLTSTYIGLNESVGGGFWFEPYEFDHSKKLYGAYVYKNGDKWDLTWDYNTEEYNYLKQDWYLSALPENWDRTKKRDKDIYWTAPYFDEVSKITMVTANSFIYDKNGKILGLATTDWGLDSILNKFEQERITPNTETFLVDIASKKMILYTPDQSMKLKSKDKIDWLNALPPPTAKINTVTQNLKGNLYRIYYAHTDNQYLYGIMIPDSEFMPEILATIRYGEIGLIVVFLIMLNVMLVLYNSIAAPVEQISTTVSKISNGDYAARTGLKGKDELSRLGQTFDHMLNDRMNTLVATEQEKENISNAVIRLLEAVSKLSQRDLTIRVPVTEDVTGPMADALNLLTDETAQVLKRVTHTAELVAEVSGAVKAQSDAAIAIAENERQAVDQTSNELAAAADDMQRIARLAQTCNATAETAIESTSTALRMVNSTVDGINNTRDTIRETEKRIKRLGERSQDITSVVNLINTIAERTHILALNASMHAASAGQAGRGFAVVANEVQRLAENAREATSRISSLVSNIQIETVDTVNAINAAINQVVDGSRLAEQAGEQMKRTQETTSELVNGVKQIAERSQDQARVSVELLTRAQQIQDGSQQTTEQLQEQTAHTQKLVEFSKDLIYSIRVFKLPL